MASWLGLIVGLLLDHPKYYWAQVPTLRIHIGNKLFSIYVFIINIDKDLKVKVGDKVSGSVAVKKNKHNPR